MFYIIDSYFAMQDPSAYPPQPYQPPPPTYDAQQCLTVEPQPAEVQVAIIVT